MKSTRPFLGYVLTIIISVLISCIMLNKFHSGVTGTTETTRETAYERVMRTGVLRCGYVAWPPFWDKDTKTGAVTGMLPDLLAPMMAALDLKIEYVETVLGQQPQDLNSGKYDSFCFDSFLMPKASKYLDYTTRVWGYMPNYMYGLQSMPVNNDLNHFNSADYMFTAMDGDISLDLATRIFPQAKLLSLPATADPSLLFLNVTSQKADLVIIDDISLNKFSKMNGQQLKRVYPYPLAVYPFNMSVKKDETGLRDMLDYAIDIFVYTGDYKVILDKHDPEHAIIRVDTKRN